MHQLNSRSRTVLHKREFTHTDCPHRYVRSQMNPYNPPKLRYFVITDIVMYFSLYLIKPYI